MMVVPCSNIKHNYLEAVCRNQKYLCNIRASDLLKDTL